MQNAVSRWVAQIRSEPLSTFQNVTALTHFYQVLNRNFKGLAGGSTGLFMSQCPPQLAAFLVYVSKRRIERYMEIGTNCGMTLITVVETLSRFHLVREAVGVDVKPCPAIQKYSSLRPGVSFLECNSQSPQFKSFVEAQECFDLIFVDADHRYDPCKSDAAIALPHARAVAFHDVAHNNEMCEGARRVWKELKEERTDLHAEEFCDSLRGSGYMGIGLLETTVQKAPVIKWG